MKTDENIQNQIINLVNFFERHIKDNKSNLLIDVAIVLNEMQEKAKQFAEPSEYADGYRDAIQEAKEKIGIKNTVYELYTDISSQLKSYNL